MKTYFPNHKRPVTLIPYMLMLPTILLLCWLLVYPVFNVFYTSFWQEMLSRPKANAFIGLKNYHKILSDPVFFEALGNSFRWVIVEVGLQLVLGLGLSLILKRKFRGCGIFRSILFLPWALSGVLVSMLWSMMYYENVGVLNDLFQRLGIIQRVAAMLLSEHRELCAHAVGQITDALGTGTAAVSAAAALFARYHAIFRNHERQSAAHNQLGLHRLVHVANLRQTQLIG